jgi:hypothetical protein
MDEVTMNPWQRDGPPLVDKPDPTTAPIPTKPTPADLLLVIFIHGYASHFLSGEPRSEKYFCRFKGTDFTFGSFPDRLQHVLSETIESMTTECILFPVYEVG